MHYVRTSRHASAIVTAVVLIAVGVIVGLTRHDGPDDGVQLRADEQTLHPSPSVTGGSGDNADADAHTPTQGSADRAPRPLGKLGAPIHAPTGGRAPTASAGSASRKPGGASTPNGTGAGSGATSTTAREVGDNTPTPTSPPDGGGDDNAAAFAPNRIAYSYGGAVWTINPDGTDARRVAMPGYFPAWSPDHSAIAYADSDKNGGGALRVVTATDDYGLTTGVATDGQPVWSPDGRRIAFARLDYTNDEYSEIWVVNKNGSAVAQLTHLSCLNRDPSWSSDGKKIAFWSSSEHCSDGNYELYAYDVASRTVAPLGTETNSGAPAWSPDSTQILFSSDGYIGVGFEIVAMNADGSNAHRVTTLSGDDTDPAWSPDGTRIVFARDGGIYTMTANGGGRTLLVAGAVQPAWD